MRRLLGTHQLHILDDSYVTVETLNLAWEDALNNGSTCNTSGSDRAMLPPEYQDCNLQLHPGAGLSVLLTQTPENHSGWVKRTSTVAWAS